MGAFTDYVKHKVQKQNGMQIDEFLSKYIEPGRPVRDNIELSFPQGRPLCSDI